MKVFYLGNTTKEAISPLNLEVKARAMYHNLLIILWLPIMGHKWRFKIRTGTHLWPQYSVTLSAKCLEHNKPPNKYQLL